MVLQLQLQRRNHLPALTALLVAAAAFAPAARGEDALQAARSLYEQGQYFTSARYAFSAVDEAPSRQGEAYSWIALGLTKAGLYNASSYFFIRALQSRDRAAARRVLPITDDLFIHVGPDLLRTYLVRHTSYEDYDDANRSAFLYALGKDALLKGNETKAIGYLKGVNRRSPLLPFALQLRGAAEAIQGQNEAALDDFRDCVSQSGSVVSGSAGSGLDGFWAERRRKQGEDLKARCQAGVARTLYQMGKYVEADRAYDEISKDSFVWTDILFEQAWNAFARREYNRTLGKLVSYKSPGLSFVFNTEVDVLRAQAYLALCLYADANQAINEFNSKYKGVGEEVKRFVERNSGDLTAFHARGKRALREKLHTRDEFNRLLNRFARSPYFQNLVAAEKAIASEKAAIARFDSGAAGVPRDRGRGFPTFLGEVLKFRLGSVRELGGAFVKNSLLDYHSVLIADFEKMAFIKLEMLSRAKERLVYDKARPVDRTRGNVEPSRRDDQYKWSFNGEFWNDEIGDYVFGLESECEAS